MKKQHTFIQLPVHRIHDFVSTVFCFVDKAYFVHISLSFDIYKLASLFTSFWVLFADHIHLEVDNFSCIEQWVSSVCIS